MTSPISYALADLTVEGEPDALGTSDHALRFAWGYRPSPADVPAGSRVPEGQSWCAVRVHAGTDDGEPVWESGRVETGTPWLVSPDDVAFVAWHRHTWELQVGLDGEILTATGSFTPAPLHERDWAGAQWIGMSDDPADEGPRSRSGGSGRPPTARERCGDGSLAAPLLERVVPPGPGIHRALLAVAAGGFADVRVDGELASDEVLSPGTTHWHRTVQVVVHDLTDTLADAPGEERPHTVSLELGRGFYGTTNPSVWHWERAPWHADPRVRATLRLEHVDGTVSTTVTDETWTGRRGPRLLDDLFGGEIVDLRRSVGGERAAAPEPATALAGPSGQLVARASPPERIIERLAPARVRRTPDGTWVVSFPRVIAGWIRLELPAGHVGRRLTVRYGERLREDGLPNADDTVGYFGDGFQTDEIVLDDIARSWEPRFSYKGFGHVSVAGWPAERELSPEDIRACVVHTDAERVGTFEVEEPLLQWIHDATVHTLENNLHGYPTDTPKYEKNGWTGDAAVGADMFLTNLDVGRLLGEYIDALAETTLDDGPPDLVAPNAGVFGVGARAPVWHSALVTIPWDLYMHTGDARPMARHADVIERYARFELGRSPGGIADTILGDWVAPGTDPGGGNPPEDSRVPATAFLVRILDTVARIRTALGQDPDWALENTARVRKAFCEEFVHPGGAEAVVAGPGDTGFRQSHHVLALAFDLFTDPQVRQAAADALAQDVRRRRHHLDTGVIGTKWLLPVLTDHGHADTAVAIARQETVPSWGAWRAAGATTMLEHWDLAARSHGHYFLGTVDDWLTGYVAGLRPLAPGWSEFAAAPALTGHLPSAAGAVRTPHGTAGVRWHAEGDGLRTTVTVPFGTRARVTLPGSGTRLLGPGRHELRSRRGPGPG